MALNSGIKRDTLVKFVDELCFLADSKAEGAGTMGVPEIYCSRFSTSAMTSEKWLAF